MSGSPVRKCPHCSSVFLSLRSFLQHISKSTICSQALASDTYLQSSAFLSPPTKQTELQSTSSEETSDSDDDWKPSPLNLFELDDGNASIPNDIASNHDSDSDDFNEAEDILSFDPDEDEGITMEYQDFTNFHPLSIEDAVAHLSDLQGLPKNVQFSIHNQLQQYHDSGYANVPLSGEYCSNVQLLHLLKTAKAPLSLYNQIQDWVHDSVVNQQVDFEQLPKSRKTLVNDLHKEFDLDGLKPKVIDYILPNSGLKVKIVVHDFLQAFYSLLTDTKLMKDDNLLFSGDTPFEDPPDPNNVGYGDVNTGTVFHHGHGLYVKVAGHDVLCPIILFIDKTSTDLHSNLCLEPVSFTLGIFKKEVRYQPSSWRNLGYVINQSLHNYPSGSGSGLQKAQDFHAVLNVIFTPLHESQQSGGIFWQLPYCGKVHDVVFKVPVLFVIGDTEGHDKMCGKFLSHSKDKVKHLCRYCNCPSDHTGDPEYKFTYTKVSQVEKLFQKGDEDGLRAMSLHYLENAFHSLLFCDPKHEIFGASPSEILHYIQKGLHPYALESLFGQKKLGVKGAKKQKQMRENESLPPSEPVIFEPIDQELLTAHGCFSPKVCKEFDKIAKIYGRYLQHQSDHNIPRTYFPQGITNNTKKNGHEMQGVLLLCIIIFCTAWGELNLEPNKLLGEERFSAYLHLFEVLVMYENYMKNSVYPKQQVRQLKQYLPKLMATYVATIDHKLGEGANLFKIHTLLHQADDIVKHGAPGNYNSGPCESNHKTGSKNPARNTQRHADVFDIQTATRTVENIAIDRATTRISITADADDAAIPSQETSSPGSASTVKIVYRGQSFVATEEGIQKKIRKGKKLEKTEWPNMELQEHIEKYIIRKILPHVKDKQLQLYTYCKRDNEKFHADPCYKGGDWQDWAYIDWDHEEGPIPGHLLIFVELTDLVSPIDIEGTFVDQPGMYAIIHSVEAPLSSVPTNSEEQNYLAHQSSHLVYYQDINTRSLLVRTDNNKRKIITVPQLYLVPCDAIESPCIGVPADLTGDTYPHGYLFLQSPSHWTDIFVKHIVDSNNAREA